MNGLVWNDADNDGTVDVGETAIQGATIELTGLDDRGNTVNRSVTTNANGVYAFLVTATGVGSRTFNVGTSGAAFSVANNSNVTVLELLRAVNSRSRKGILFDLDRDGDATNCLESRYRTMANIVFTGINEAGDI